MAIVINSKEEFHAKLESAGDSLVVVYLTAAWCGPCRAVAPQIDKLAKKYENVVLILKVDIDVVQDIASEYEVTGVPTFAFVKSKQVVTRFTGADAAKVGEVITQHI